jgi:hypothetical protein
MEYLEGETLAERLKTGALPWPDFPPVCIDNPLEAGILSMWQRMRSGRLKVFASLSKYLEERRLYRRDEKDQIVKQGDDLQDAARCLVNGVSRMRTKPQPVPHSVQ